MVVTNNVGTRRLVKGLTDDGARKDEKFYTGIKETSARRVAMPRVCESRSGHTYRQVDEHVAPQVQGPESREVAHPWGQVGDFVAARVELGQPRHPAQFVRQRC